MTKTLADFKPPYSAEWVDDPLYGRWLCLRKNGKGWKSYSPATWGSDQACIDVAWKREYSSYTPSEFHTLREVNAELLKALKAFHPDNIGVGSAVNLSALRTAWENAIAAIQKAEGR